MKSLILNKLANAVFVVLMIASSAPSTVDKSSAVPNMAQPHTPPWMPGPRIVRVADDRYSTHRVRPPRRANLNIPNSTFEIQWNPAACPDSVKPWPQEAQQAFQYAANIWGSLLDSEETIEVIACWLPGSFYDIPNWLGAARAVSTHKDFPHAPSANTYYPAALANALAGHDLNDVDGWDADDDGQDIDADIDGWFNADQDAWYFRTDGNPAPSEVDFVSLVLHELGHGLGFYGWAEVDIGDNACRTRTPGDGCIGPPPLPPMTYDQFTTDGTGKQLLAYENPSLDLGNALSNQAGGLFFNGPQATAANSGPVKLYAPNPWNASSYDHVDEQTFNNTPNSLMTPVQSNGESEHHPGPVTLAMFQDMGWGAVNTAPTLAGLPDQVVAIDKSKDNAIDLWAYASDGQSPVDALTFAIVGTPAPNAGISLDSNRYIDITPAAGWTGETEVTIQATDPGDMSITDTFSVSVLELEMVYLPLAQRGQAAQPSDWTTIVSEDFEGTFPSSGWQVLDENSAGDPYYWDKRECRNSGGTFSAWSVGAGSTALACGSEYPGEVFAWMIYGPFSLADASAAELVFDWWSDTAGSGDEFFFGASTDDYNYHGVHITGNHASWTSNERLDLSAVPELGSLLGQTEVWIAFSFQSDVSAAAEGTYVDNIVIRKKRTATTE